MGETGTPPAEGDGQTYAWAKQYRTLHGRAHRKAPARVGTPALTRHLAFWMPQVEGLGDGGAGKSDFQSRRDQWVRDLDWFLASLILNAYEGWETQDLGKAFQPRSFNAQRSKITGEYLFHFFHHTAKYNIRQDNCVRFEKVSASGQPEDETWAARFEQVSFRVYFDNVPVKIRAELHTEYCTLTMMAVLDLQNGDRTANRVSKTCRALTKAFRAFNAVTSQRYVRSIANQTRSDVNDVMKMDIKALGSAPQMLFRDFWREFDTCVIKPALHPTISAPLEPVARTAPASIQKKIGSAVVDFRGLIVSTNTKKWDRKVMKRDAPERPAVSIFDKAFTPPLRTDSHRLHGRIPPKKQVRLIEALMPMMEAARSAICPVPDACTVERAPPRFEYAASALHGGRGVFMSALGPQLINSSTRDPGCYVVITNHRNRWQIGRLLDRLHTVGTLRIASMWDYAKLNRAGYPLRQALLDVDAANKAPDADQVAALMGRFHEVSSDAGDEGIQYRLERACYYISQFDKECHSLRFERIEGYLPYELFVKRRMGDTWEYFHRLRERYDRVAAALALLNSEVRAREELAQTKKVRELQTFAEQVAVVPIAYYGGSIISSILPTLKNAHAALPAVLAAILYWIILWLYKRETENGWFTRLRRTLTQSEAQPTRRPE